MAGRIIEFVFRGDASQLKSAIGGVTTSIEGFEAKARKAGDAVGRQFKGVAAAAGVGAAAIAGVMAGVVKLSAVADGFAKSAKKIGSSAEEIQRVGGAFGLMAENAIDAARVIQDLGITLADAKDGTAEAVDALGKLGLTFGDLIKLPAAEQIATIADRFRQLEDPAIKSQVAIDLFKRSGRELVPVLDEGGEAFRESIRQIERHGFVTNETAAESEVLQDEITLMGAALSGLSRDALAPLIPQMTEMVMRTTEAVVAARESPVFGDMARFLLDVGYGAGLAAEKLAILTGVIGKPVEKAGGVFAQGPEIDALVKKIETYQGLLDDTAAVAERHADESGAWREGDLRSWEDQLAALKALQAQLGELRRAGGPVAPSGAPAPRGASPSLPSRASSASAGPSPAEAEADLLAALLAVGAAVDDVKFRQMDRAAQAATANAQELAEIQRLAEVAIGTAGVTEEQRLAILAQANEARVALAEELARELDAIRQEDLERTREDADARIEADARVAAERMAGIEEVRQAEASSITAALQQTQTVLGAIGSLVDTVMQTRVDAAEEGSEAEKQALKEQWEAQTAVAILQAAINIPLSISQASAGTWPAAIGFMVAAGVASAAAFAGVVAKAAAGPSFHSGGFADSGPPLAADEFQATLRRNEAVLPPAAVASLGGRGAVERVIRGEQPPDRSTLILQMNNRTVDVQSVEAIRRPGSPLAAAIRQSQPRRVGSARVW